MSRSASLAASSRSGSKPWVIQCVAVSARGLVSFMALVAALYRARRAFSLPDEAAGRRRLEQASGMPGWTRG